MCFDGAQVALRVDGLKRSTIARNEITVAWPRSEIGGVLIAIHFQSGQREKRQARDRRNIPTPNNAEITILGKT